MDVADPGAADLTDGPPPRRRIPLSWLIYVVLLALVGVTIYFGLALRRAAHRDDLRDEALSAARQQAVNLTSVDYRTATHDLQRIIDGSTGDQRHIYESELKALPGALRQSKSVSTGEVLAAGVVSAHGDKATVALAVNQSSSTSGAPGTIVTSRRIVLDMQRVHGHWLVRKETFVGIGVPHEA